MVQQPRVHQWGPNLTPPVPGAVPQQGGCPGMALGGEWDQGLLLWGTLWWRQAPWWHRRQTQTSRGESREEGERRARGCTLLPVP